MSYGSRLAGALALHPPPPPALVAELRAALDGLSASQDVPSRQRSAWRLTPLGGGLVNEAEQDWETQVDALNRALGRIFSPRAVSLEGRLEAIGEDDELLAIVRVDASGVVVERIEQEDSDPQAWIALLTSGTDDDRKVAAEQLAACDAAEAVPALARALSDKRADVRRCALESLGSFEEAALPALEPVIASLSDDDPFVRYWATFALGRMGRGAEPALVLLEELTRDTADGPRYGALDAIRRIRA